MVNVAGRGAARHGRARHGGVGPGVVRQGDGVTLTFDNGGVTFIHEDAEKAMGRDILHLRQIADLTTKRASHVEPDANGDWFADMSPVNGPILGPFPLRIDALAAEHQWLEMHL